MDSKTGRRFLCCEFFQLSECLFVRFYEYRLDRDVPTLSFVQTNVSRSQRFPGDTEGRIS
jgi:hypothetical protein